MTWIVFAIAVVALISSGIALKRLHAVRMHIRATQPPESVSYERTVFLSYRRKDQGWALAIRTAPQAHGFEVFLDVDDLGAGAWKPQLEENIASRAHFALLLTHDALDRCNQAADVLRLEIQCAISRRLNIVPLFLEPFSFTAPATSSPLTGQLQRLSAYNGVEFSGKYFSACVKRLIDDFLSKRPDAVHHPPSQLSIDYALSQASQAEEIYQTIRADYLGRHKHPQSPIHGLPQDVMATLVLDEGTLPKTS